MLSIEAGYLGGNCAGVSSPKVDLQRPRRRVTLNKVGGNLTLPIVGVAALEDILDLYHQVRAD